MGGGDGAGLPGECPPFPSVSARFEPFDEPCPTCDQLSQLSGVAKSMRRGGPAVLS